MELNEKKKIFEDVMRESYGVLQLDFDKSSGENFESAYSELIERIVREIFRKKSDSEEKLQETAGNLFYETCDRDEYMRRELFPGFDKSKHIIKMLSLKGNELFNEVSVLVINRKDDSSEEDFPFDGNSWPHNKCDGTFFLMDKEFKKYLFCMIALYEPETNPFLKSTISHELRHYFTYLLKKRRNQEAENSASGSDICLYYLSQISEEEIQIRSKKSKLRNFLLPDFNVDFIFKPGAFIENFQANINVLKNESVGNWKYNYSYSFVVCCLLSMLYYLSDDELPSYREQVFNELKDGVRKFSLTIENRYKFNKSDDNMMMKCSITYKKYKRIQQIVNCLKKNEENPVLTEIIETFKKDFCNALNNGKLQKLNTNNFNGLLKKRLKEFINTNIFKLYCYVLSANGKN